MLPPDLVLVGFAGALRHAGAPVTADRVHAFLRAVVELGPSHVYWAGRATLCTGPDDTDRYDEVFAAWFAGDLPTTPRQRQRPTIVPARAQSGESTADGTGTEVIAASASDLEVLRHRDVADLTDAERAELNRLFGRLRVRIPRRRSARRRPANRGEIDPRRTLREQLRHAGEPARVRRRRRSTKPRRVILLIDVSGSMSPYADSILRLAHSITRNRQVEVFTMGTRLTRVTTAMRHQDPERALRLAGEAIPDWSGGTRLGEVLEAFLDRWGQRGMARRAVVVICSDGWERGDPTLLGEQMRRLSRLAHRVVWLNPHRGKPGYRPIQSGIAAALPHVDAMVAGHSLASYDWLLDVIGGTALGARTKWRSMGSATVAATVASEVPPSWGGSDA